MCTARSPPTAAKPRSRSCPANPRHAQFRWACDHRLREAFNVLADSSRRQNPGPPTCTNAPEPAAPATNTPPTSSVAPGAKSSGASGTTTTRTTPPNTPPDNASSPGESCRLSFRPRMGVVRSSSRLSASSGIRGTLSRWLSRGRAVRPVASRPPRAQTPRPEPFIRVNEIGPMAWEAQEGERVTRCASGSPSEKPSGAPPATSSRNSGSSQR